ncbi:uncharacterized protein ARB_03379 [Trichophyton benhamiae CBS 112371]|uniref:Uncharacterized protein n=1 Tax=Arthroderma benhamiae (strain ATCC MYA-4681 / CBS 112371) TaxID=663331 RepID=D4B4I9_ARTBC|nr:uncharacterized protein ARB_03379 [Trichophyton benhamiae CBS 112371]EFE30037.1 hypothetical protein ARB_03379 [Trichophyton benhamiae CBS 112371]
MAPAAAMHPGLFVFDQAMGILDSSVQFRVAGRSSASSQSGGASVTSPTQDEDEPGGSRRKGKKKKKTTKKKQYIHLRIRYREKYQSSLIRKKAQKKEEETTKTPTEPPAIHGCDVMRAAVF